MHNIQSYCTIDLAYRCAYPAELAKSPDYFLLGKECGYVRLTRTYMGNMCDAAKSYYAAHLQFGIHI